MIVIDQYRTAVGALVYVLDALKANPHNTTPFWLTYCPQYNYDNILPILKTLGKILQLNISNSMDVTVGKVLTDAIGSQ